MGFDQPSTPLKVASIQIAIRDVEMNMVTFNWQVCHSNKNKVQASQMLGQV